MTDCTGTDGDRLYHVDGELVAAERATVNVRDRGFMYGDAAFETLRAYGGRVFEWERHADRLRATCESLGMAEAVPSDLRSRVRATLDANGLQEASVRVSVTRGIQPGKLTPHPDVEPTVTVVASPLPPGGIDGDTPWDSPATVQTVDARKPPASVLPPDAKTHNYLPGVLARLELRGSTPDERRPDEALLRDIQGNLAEGTTSNVFFVDDGTVKTPSTDLPLLPGVTRAVVLELAEAESLPVEAGRYAVEAVRSADEAFLTNTTWEIRPIATVDGVSVGGGPVTDLLSRLFDERVQHRHYADSPG